MTLRARIVLVTVGLFLVALATANFATYLFVSSFLLERVDETLRAATAPASAALSDESLHAGGQVPPSIQGQHRSFLPDGSYAALVDGRGHVQRQARFAFGDGSPRPKLPEQLIGTLGDEPTLTTVTDVEGKTQYRLIASRLERGRTLVVAVPLSDVRATQRRLLLIEAAVSQLVIALLAAAAYWATRVELRPLERMAKKAGAIAAGDLSQRVAPDNPRTEVGRLGGALNTMLAHIERAFAERLAAEERLRQFVADASHELRTPVTSIRGYAELFRRGAAERPDDLALVMRRIEQEGERMGELVEELLLLARLDDGASVDRERVELGAVTDAAVEAARVADPERPVAVDVQRPLTVLGTASRLRRVVDNLLTNARVHTPPRTPVYVSLASDGDDVVLEVADAGPGVPPAEAERIFERFYRTDRARTRSQGGVGLGLAIVRAIVEAHGGSVGYRPRAGGGSVFRVVLPRAAAADVRAEAVAAG